MMAGYDQGAYDDRRFQSMSLRAKTKIKWRDEDTKQRQLRKKEQKQEKHRQKKADKNMKKLMLSEDENESDDSEYDEENTKSSSRMSRYFVPRNALLDTELEKNESLVEFASEAKKIGLKISFESPWRRETEINERKLYDTQGNVLFQIYEKRKKKSGANLAIVMGRDASIKVMDINKTLNMLVFSVTEPKRVVNCDDFTEEQIAFLNRHSPNRTKIPQKIVYTNSTQRYMVYVSPNRDLYVWRAMVKTVFDFLGCEAEPKDHHDSVSYVQQIAANPEWLFNPVTIENDSINLIWWKPTTAETFGQAYYYHRHYPLSVVINSNTPRWKISAFAKKPNLQFEIIPDNWKAFVSHYSRYYNKGPGWIEDFQYPTGVSFVRGTIDHFHFPEWRELIQLTLRVPPNIADCSIFWNI
eukprot:TRINITY_DN828_c0_g1_i2.p1 TRINITY_DN828_c0_g1~~TRINITY_DN828_c0_g1_i2.p1  ORF type:complete len:412 (+),score=96.49 TRINITY_DN828_c0_g1_i2:132-1367(+)